MHLSASIQSHESRVLSPSSYCTSESTTGLVDHLLHSRLTGTRPVHFPAVRPTFGHLENTFYSSPLLPKPSLTCLGPSSGTSLSHLRPPHISWLSHHSQVCCSTVLRFLPLSGDFELLVELLNVARRRWRGTGQGQAGHGRDEEKRTKAQPWWAPTSYRKNSVSNRIPMRSTKHLADELRSLH